MDRAETFLAELRSLSHRRRGLLLQALPMAVSGAGLVIGAEGLEAAPADLRFLFLAATGLFSLAVVHWVDEVAAILHAECPRCAGRFFGVPPEAVPSPLRRRCCQCGLPLSEPEGPGG